MIRCPNKNTKAWKRMVEKLGESEAYYAYMQNDYDLLDEKELDEYVAEDEKKIEDITTNLQQEPTDSLFSDEILGDASNTGTYSDEVLNDEEKIHLEKFRDLEQLKSFIDGWLLREQTIRNRKAFEKDMLRLLDETPILEEGVENIDNWEYQDFIDNYGLNTVLRKKTPSGYVTISMRPVRFNLDINLTRQKSEFEKNFKKPVNYKRLKTIRRQIKNSLVNNTFSTLESNSEDYVFELAIKLNPDLDIDSVKDSLYDMYTSGLDNREIGIMMLHSLFNQPFSIKEADVVDLSVDDTPPAFSTGLPPETPIADVALKTLLDNLSNRFDIRYHMVTDDEAKDILGKHYKPNTKGFFYKGQAYMILGKADLGTAIHEFVHPFVDILEKQDPSLFKRLVEEAQDAIDGGWLEPLDESYNSLDKTDYEKELIVHAIEHLGKNKIDKKTGNVLINLLNKFLDFIKDIIGQFGVENIQDKLYDDTAEVTYRDLVKSLSYSTTLSDITNILLMSKAKIVDSTSLKQEYTIENIFALNESNMKSDVIPTAEKKLTNRQKDIESYNAVIKAVEDGLEITMYADKDRKEGSGYSYYGTVEIDSNKYTLRRFNHFDSFEKTGYELDDSLEVQEYSNYKSRQRDLNAPITFTQQDSLDALNRTKGIVTEMVKDAAVNLNNLKTDKDIYTDFINQLKADRFDEAGMDIAHLESLLNSADRDSAKLAAQIILSQIKSNGLMGNYTDILDRAFDRLDNRSKYSYVIPPSDKPRFSLGKQTSTNISTLEFAPLFSKLNDITDKLTKFKSNTFSSSEAPKPIDIALIPTDSIFNKLTWFAKKYNDELKAGILDFKQREQILDALINSAKLLTKKIAKGQVNALPLDEDYKQNLVDMLLDPEQNSIAIEILNGMYSAYGVTQPDLSQAALEKDAIDEYLATDTNHKAGQQAIKIFLDDLKTRTGVDYKFITNEQMTTNAGSGTTAYYDPNDNTTYFRELVSFDTVFHEFCHPFVTTLRLTNPDLFNTLYNQITDGGKNVMQFYPNKETLAHYQNLGQEQEETFVRAMEQLGSGLINRSTGKPIIEAIQRFLDWLKRFLFGDLQSTIIVKDLSVNTTLRELTEMMLAHKGKIEMFRGSVMSRMMDDNVKSITNKLKSISKDLQYLNKVRNTIQDLSYEEYRFGKTIAGSAILDLDNAVRSTPRGYPVWDIPMYTGTNIDKLDLSEETYNEKLNNTLDEDEFNAIKDDLFRINTQQSNYYKSDIKRAFPKLSEDQVDSVKDLLTDGNVDLVATIVINLDDNINRQLEIPDNSEEIANRKVSKVEDILERGIRLKQFVDTAASRSKQYVIRAKQTLETLQDNDHLVYTEVNSSTDIIPYYIHIRRKSELKEVVSDFGDMLIGEDGFPLEWTTYVEKYWGESLKTLRRFTDEELDSYINYNESLLEDELLEYSKWKLAQQDIDSAIDTFVDYANEQDLNLSKEYLSDPSAVYVVAGAIDEQALDNTIELIDEAYRNLSEKQIKEVYEEDDLPFSLFTSDDILAKDELLDLATKLSTQLQVPFALVDKPEAKWAGMFKDGKVYLNLARVTAETPFHEFCHPLVDSIKRDNPNLYQALLSELKTTSYGKKLLAEAQDLYDTGNRTQDEIEEEAIVELIARFATGKISEQELNSTSNKSLFTKLIEFLKNIGKLLFRMSSDKAQSMKSVYEKTWHVEDFSSKWRAIDIANVLRYGTRINGEYNTLIKAGDQIVRTLSGEEGYKAEESKFWPQHTYSVEQLGGVYHYIGAYMNNAGISKVGDAIENFTSLLSKPNSRVELAATSGSSDQEYLAAVSKIRIHFKDDARVKYAFSVDIGSVLQKTKGGNLRRVTTRDKFLYDNPDNPFLKEEKDIFNDSPYDEVIINATKDNIKEIELILTEDEYFNIQQTLELKQANLDVKGETLPKFYIYYKEQLHKLADITGANITYSASDGTSSDTPLYTPKPRKTAYGNRVKFSLFANPIDQQVTDTSASTSSTQVNLNTSDFNVIVIGDNLSKSEETQLAKLQSQPNVLIHEQSLADNYNSTLASIKDMLSTLDSISNAGLVMMGESNFNKESLANDIFTNFDANYSNC